MIDVSSPDLDKAIKSVLDNLAGINHLYPGQLELLQSLLQNDNIFYTSATNSGKTLPAVIYPYILKELNKLGYKFPVDPKAIFVTALNSIKVSLVNNVKNMGIDAVAVTSENIKEIIDSSTSVLFISPEVLKLPAVTQILLQHRSKFVLKVVDEAHLGKRKFKNFKTH